MRINDSIFRILLITIFFASCANEETYLNRGIERRKSGDFSAAYQEFSKALERNPNFARAYALRGATLMELKRNREALIDLNQALQINPQDYISLSNRMNVYYRLGKFEDALKDVVRGDVPGNDHLDMKAAMLVLGSIMSVERKQFEQAKNYALKAISLRDDVRFGYFYLAKSYESLSDYPAAIEAYTKTLSYNPDDMNSYVNRGAMYANVNNYQNALADYNKAINLDSNIALPYYNRGLTYLKLEKIELAFDDFKKAIELDPKQVYAWINLSELYRQKGEINKSREALNFAFANTKQEVSELNFIITQLLRVKDYFAALFVATKIVEIDPSNAKSYYSRAYIYHLMGRWTQAKADYEKAYELDHSYAEIYAIDFPETTCGWMWDNQTTTIVSISKDC